MAFLTYEKIAEFARLDEARREIRKAASAPTTKTLFLSHSSKDKSHIPGVLGFFAGFGATVYVDELDLRLRRPTSPDTARLLRKEISSCPRFVVLVSPNSHESKWIPWELGLADGLKGVAPVALLPIRPQSESDETWGTQEYLGLYPRVVFGPVKGHVGDIWNVLDPRDDKCWGLKKWLFEEVS